MCLRKRPINLKSRINTIFAGIVKIYLYVELLMTLKSAKPFFNSCTIRVAIKNKKALTDEQQININGITYMQKSSLIYNHVRSINAVIFFDLKRHYIPLGYLFCSKELVSISLIYLFAKVTNSLQLYVVIYQVEQKLNLCLFFLLGELQIFFGRMLFGITVILEN